MNGRTNRTRKIARIAATAMLALVALLASACSGGGGAGADTTLGMGPGPGAQGSNKALFTFDCDLQGVTGALTLEIEAVASSGVVWGPGPNPTITGVIGTGDYIYYTAGDLTSPVARYLFTGENDYADFVSTTSSERFLVQFVSAHPGLVLVVEPFGPAPSQIACVETGAQFL